MVICGDYSLTINQVTLLDAYSLPKVDDLIAMLAEGKTFINLDLVHAYQQLVLEEQSRKLTTINTLRGLFKYTGLPFSILVAPSIYSIGQ